MSFDLLTMRSCHVMLPAWSTAVPCSKWIALIVSELARPQRYIDRQLKELLRFCGQKGQLSNFFLLTQKRSTLVSKTERQTVTYCAWRCVQKCDLWLWRKNQKRKKLQRVKFAVFQEHPLLRSPWNFACGVLCKRYDRFSESELWEVEYCHAPLTWPIQLIQHILVLCKPW